MSSTQLQPDGLRGFNLSDAEFARVQKLAMRLAGICLPASKKALVVGRWSKRLNHYGLKSFAEYLELLSTSAGTDERQTALNLLTTNETHFFREDKHFDFLRRQVLPAARRRGTFRIWSAACSSGEEPYSLAMLLATELGDNGWDILASDISTRVLDSARTGHYDMSRAKTIPPEYLRRFCLKGAGPQAGTFLIARSLRERIQFRQINLNEQLPTLAQFDAILLRNVMIYFDEATKTRVVARLISALKPGGHFIVGHCETLNGITSELTLLSASIYAKPVL